MVMKWLPESDGKPFFGVDRAAEPTRFRKDANPYISRGWRFRYRLSSLLNKLADWVMPP